MLKHRQNQDKYRPLVSEEFMQQAETILRETLILEKQLLTKPDAETQEKYDSLIQKLEELIEPSCDDEK